MDWLNWGEGESKRASVKARASSKSNGKRHRKSDCSERFHGITFPPGRPVISGRDDLIDSLSNRFIDSFLQCCNVWGRREAMSG